MLCYFKVYSIQGSMTQYQCMYVHSCQWQGAGRSQVRPFCWVVGMQFWLSFYFYKKDMVIMSRFSSIPLRALNLVSIWRREDKMVEYPKRQWKNEKFKAKMMAHYSETWEMKSSNAYLAAPTSTSPWNWHKVDKKVVKNCPHLTTQ